MRGVLQRRGRDVVDPDLFRVSILCPSQVIPPNARLGEEYGKERGDGEGRKTLTVAHDRISCRPNQRTSLPTGIISEKSTRNDILTKAAEVCRMKCCA